MKRALIAATLALLAVVSGPTGSAVADEWQPRARRSAAVAPARDCGCCGCLVVSHVRHRQLAMTYGYGLDPRRREEPHYYWGPVRSFPRYQVVGAKPH